MTREQLLTDPEQAADFVKRTQLDALAIAIGTSHGAYKFTRKPTGDILAIDRIKEIHRRIPNTHLVMHGTSSVPQDLLADIRKYGGNMKETYGVPVEEIQEAIKHGVRKINIDTDIRLAMTGAIRKFLAENPEKFDPREYLKPAREAAKQICKQRYEQFGCEGQAGKIKADAAAGRRRRSTPRANWPRSFSITACGARATFRSSAWLARSSLASRPHPVHASAMITSSIITSACRCWRAARCATTTRSATTDC